MGLKLTAELVKEKSGSATTRMIAGPRETLPENGDFLT